jgi:prepilin-type N-terminal cleavage/methylation domain-containing protein
VKKSRAWTLLEVMVCIGIIGILASLLFPVFAKAKMSAKEKVSFNNLRQGFIAISLYREANDSRVEYGSAVDMGLPEFLPEVADKVSSSLGIWKSPCCCHQDAPTGAPSYTKTKTDFAWFAHDPDFWPRYVQRFQSTAVLLSDYHCSPRSTNLYNPQFGDVRGIAVKMDGSLEARTRRIAISNQDIFWH